MTGSSSGSLFLGWKSTSKRWDADNHNHNHQPQEVLNAVFSHGIPESDTKGMMLMTMKRVMVVVDKSSHSKHAMMWALTHVTNKGDILTLLHIVPPSSKNSSLLAAASLASLCQASKPEVEVEALVVHGPKEATVMAQVKKLEVSVLVLGQPKISLYPTCLCSKSSTEEFVEECINTTECLTIGVRKQSSGVSGYLISTRWRKNFWLLA